MRAPYWSQIDLAIWTLILLLVFKSLDKVEALRIMTGARIAEDGL